MGRENIGCNKVKKGLSRNRKYAVIVLIVGLIFSIVVAYKSAKDSHLVSVDRNDYQGGEKDVSLITSTRLGDKEVNFVLSDRKYDAATIQEYFTRLSDELPSLIIGSNESVDKVTTDLVFAASFEGYPFSLSYQTSPEEIIDSEGKLVGNVTQEQPVIVTATAEYEDFEAYTEFGVNVIPGREETLESLVLKIQNAIEQGQEEGRETISYELPSVINGEKVTYKKDGSNKSIIIAVYALIIATCLFFSDHFMKLENEKKRKKEILETYPFFTQKFSMLCSSGMTPRQVFTKLSDNYRKDGHLNNAFYEEIVKTVYEMESGVAEVKAYESFDRRCGVREVSVFVSLLIQNLRKGSLNLGKEMRYLSKEAVSEKRGELMRIGEAAGNKLLFPMIIMLVIVFALIMIPAFLSFSGF